MTKDEALRLALEALESIFASTHPYREDGTCTINDDSVELSNKAITAIEEALEAKDKPAVNNKDTALRLAIESLCCVRDMVGHPDNLEYIDHQVAKIEAALEAKDEPWESEMRNELVALGFDGQCPESIGITLKRWRDGYASAQRKPLTENEIKHLWYEACQTSLELTSQLIVHLARNIEAAHGIKELKEYKK